MSYASLIKTVPESLRSSTGLAALASLGIHGLLGAVLPLLPLDSKAVEPQMQESIGLVELTASEQSRIPQAATEQITLPAIGTPSSVLSPLSPPPPLNLPSTPNSLYNYPALATQPLPPLPPPPPLNLPLPGVPPVYKYPFRADLPQPIRVPLTAPYQNNQSFSPQSPATKLSIPLPSQINSPQPLPPPPFAPPTNLKLPSTPLEPATLFPAQNTNLPQNQVPIANPQITPPATSVLTEKFTDRGREELEDRFKKLRLSARNPAGSTVSATPQQNINRQIIDFRPQTKLPISTRPEKLPERGRELILARREELRREEFKGNSSTSTSAAVAQKTAQLDKYEMRQNTVQENHPKVKTKSPIYKTLRNCQKQFDGSTAVIGVVVDTEGKIISEPEFIQKPSAAGAEQVAKDYVMMYPFPKTDESINQYFNLEFKYNTGNCPKPTAKLSPS